MLRDHTGINRKLKTWRKLDKMPIYESGTADIMREDRYTYLVAEEEERRER